MKKLFPLLLCALLLLGCTPAAQPTEGEVYVATTYPVYMLTRELLAGTSHAVELLVQDEVSCLHDYAITTTDMKRLERAKVVVMNGVGLEDFMEDMLAGGGFVSVDASQGVPLLEWGGHAHTHEGEASHEAHVDELDPHIWLDLERYAAMLANIAEALRELEAEDAAQISENEARVTALLAQTHARMLAQAQPLEIITFHDGFSYFADAYDLQVLKAIEEESGSEASAKDMEEIVALIQTHELAAIYTELLGADATAQAIARETGVQVGALDMCMSGDAEASLESYLARVEGNLTTILALQGA